MLAALIVFGLLLLGAGLHWVLTAPEACGHCGAEGCDGSRAKCPERLF